MFKYATRLTAVAAIVPIGLALSAVPGQAQVASGDVTVTGTATCNVDTGHPTWTLHWTIDNTVTIEIPGAAPLGSHPTPQIVGTPAVVEIESADESGLIEADILSGVAPNPIPADGSAAATDGPVPNAGGDITLSVGWATDGAKGTAEGTIHLDGTCVLPDVTVAPTTAPPAVKTAVAAAPAFTG